MLHGWKVSISCCYWGGRMFVIKRFIFILIHIFGGKFCLSPLFHRDQCSCAVWEYFKTDQCLNCQGGGWGLNPPTVLSTPPITHCQIMFWGSAIHRIYIIILVGLRQSKSSTPANFSQFKHRNRHMSHCEGTHWEERQLFSRLLY